MKKRTDGRYCKQVLIGYSPNGKRKMQTIYGKTIKEVEKKERELRQALSSGTYIEETKTTVGEWATIWLDTYKRGLKSNTYNVYKYCISAHFSEIACVKLSDLKLAHLQSIVNKLIRDNNHRAAEIFKSTVSQMLDKAIDNELLAKNIAKKIELPKRQKLQKRALENDEITEILSLNISPKVRCFIKIMLYCGLRRGEAWALTKNDVDLQQKTISVNKTVYFDTTEGRQTKLGTPKSRSSNRIIPIPDVLLDDLIKHIETLHGEHLFEIDGKLMKDYQFQKMWNEFITIYRADVANPKSDITPHIFRHTYATMLYNAGVDIKTAQYLLGHATIQMTLDIYTHLQEGKDKIAIAKLNELIAKN